MLSVIGYFARDLIAQAHAFTHDVRIRRFWLNIVLAFLPAAVIGLLLRNWIKAVLFASPTVIAWAFIIGGLVLLAVEWLPKRLVTTKDAIQIARPQALYTGLAQVMALVPGVSRSCATIVRARLTGVDWAV